MTPLRQRMLEDLCRHNYAPRTQQTYVAHIARLARHFGVSPDRLTREQVQEYQDLLTGRRVSWLPQAIAAIQFFYNTTLARDWKITHSFRPKPQRARVALTLEEVSRLLAAVEPLKARVLLTTMYGCGLRVSEALRLEIRDIDSQRMVIHIRQSKGRKDRYLPLGHRLLEAAVGWKDLKAKIGFFAILHTWGQKLDLHPHLHCVVPGGGISLDGSRWVPCPRGFFLPVKLLSRMFRGTFLALLKAAHGRGQLVCKGQLQSLESHAAFNAWLSPLYAKDWVVYAQPPWNGPEHVLKYLARYTHRVAIANSRLQSIDNGQVTFTYKDYRHEHRQRTLTLSALEFMRRFLMHVVPSGFMRIRYYGFLANAHREEQLRKIRELLSASPVADTDADHGDSPSDSASPSDDLRCPLCKQGVMVTIETTPRPKLSEILHLPLMVPT